MKNLTKSALASAAIVAAGSLWVGDLGAHGGTYRGPGDTVPPGAGGGGGSGGSTGGGAAAPGSTPVGGPSTGTPTGPVGGSGGNTPTSTGGESLVDLELWTFWWEFNKDPFLNLKAAIYDGAGVSGDDDLFIGRGNSADAKATFRPTKDQIGRAAAAIKEMLETESNNDIVTGCLIALAKIGDTVPEDGPSEFEKIIRPFLADSNQEIHETAAIALGILANPSSLDTLEALVLDTEAGQKLVASSEVDLRTRSFSGYGLGLMGAAVENEAVRRRIVQIAAEAFEESNRLALPDLGVALITSIGLTPLPMAGAAIEAEAEYNAWDSREAQVAWLLEQMDDSRLNRFIQSHVPVALGRLTQDSGSASMKVQVAEALLRPLDKRKGKDTSIELRQSSAFALGLLGDCDDDEIDVKIREALTKEIKNQENQTRKFGLIALAKTGARKGDNSDDTEDPWSGRKDVEDFLLGRLKGTNGEDHWAALSMGVYGFLLAEEDDQPSLTGMKNALLTAFQKAKSADQVGAYAMGLGMLRHTGAKEAMLDRLDKISEPAAQGYVALGLGLVNDSAARKPIQELVAESEYIPDRLKQAAIALGLLGDKTAAKDLINMLAGAETISTQAAIASALGFIGDGESVDPLIEMLRDDQIPDTGRAFAAVALGIVSDKEPLPWNSKIAVDVNYRSSTTTLNTTDGLGILNIL